MAFTTIRSPLPNIEGILAVQFLITSKGSPERLSMDPDHYDMGSPPEIELHAVLDDAEVDRLPDLSDKEYSAVVDQVLGEGLDCCDLTEEE